MIYFWSTSNVTGRHRGPKRKLRAGYNLQSAVTSSSYMCRLSYFTTSSAVSRAFSALCVYSTFGHHPHPTGYLCAKFRFRRTLQCWASPWKKIAYSVTLPDSLTQLIWWAGNQSFRFGTEDFGTQTDIRLRTATGLFQLSWTNLTITSNVTGRHQGPKQKLWAPWLVTERRSSKRKSRPKRLHYNARHMLRWVFIVERGIARFLCAMRVFEVRASSSSPRLPLCQILFLSRPPLLS